MNRAPDPDSIPFASLLALACLLLAGTLPSVGLPGIFCPFRAMTGLPCASCGLTRALIAAARGEWGRSFALHPLAPPLSVGLLCVAAAGLLPPARRRALSARLLTPRLLRAAALVALAALLVNAVIRTFWLLICHQPSIW